MNTIPGDLTSPTAGPLLRPGAPVRLVTCDPDGGLAWLCVGCTNDGKWRLAAYVDGIGHTSYEDPANLALDLTDPAGMDLAARWLARHHGLPVGATAPNWREDDLGHGRVWYLSVTGSDWVAFADAWPRWQRARNRHGIPGISTLTNPAAALALACLAAGGR